MDSEYILMPNGELYHWGIKGMKWGIRRYQNKDGSLTAAGKKRYGDDDGVETSKKKTVKDMTDEEIRSAIARKQLENQYLQYYPNPTKPESFGKRFIDQAVKPAAINAGRDFIEKGLKKVSADILKDKVDPNSLEAIEAANKKLRAKITNEWLKKGIDTTANWEAGAKQYKLGKDMQDDADAKKKAKADEEAAKKAADEQKKRYEDDMKKYRDYNDNWYDNDNPPDSRDATYSRKGGERDYVNPNESRGLVVYSPQSTSVGRSTVNNYNGWDNSYSDAANSSSAATGSSSTQSLLDKYGNVLIEDIP